MSKVLIADDDRISCKLLSSLLTKWGYEADVVYNGDDALRQLLKPEAPRLAILDWMMPGLDGIEVIRKLRATHNESYVYALLLTSKEQKEDLLQGLDAGADDYLKKPFDAQELRARLRIGGRILELERRLVGALESAEYKATHDFLSGVYNRAAITELLTREASRCKRSGQKMTVMMVDVDHFKAINDTYGHPAGDEVIKELTRRIISVLRTYDAVGRLGGEEFLILTPNCALNEAMRVAERLRQCVANEKMAVGQLGIPVTVSVGVSAVAEDLADVKMGIETADLALYAAKKNGRNRVECYVSPGAAPADSLPDEKARVALGEARAAACQKS
jgi:two-component system cell cycle response regulator